MIKSLVQGPDDDDAKHTIVQARKPALCVLVLDRMRVLVQFQYLTRTLMLWFVWTTLCMANSTMCVFLDESFATQVSSRDYLTLLLYSILVA